MRPVVGGIERAGWMIISNVFAVKTSEKRWLLVDTGHMFERPRLLAELRASGIGPASLDAVLLTHRHSDHSGNARFFQQQGVPVICHRMDAEVLAGRATSEKLRRRGVSPHAIVAGLLAEYENRFAVKLVPDRVVEDGEDVFGFEVRWMPGHTEGSTFFVHEKTRALFSGDTLLAAIPPLVLRRGLALPYATFSVDHGGALESLKRFFDARVDYDVLCAGHGAPLVERASEIVQDFLERKLVRGERTIGDRIAEVLGVP